MLISQPGVYVEESLKLPDIPVLKLPMALWDPDGPPQQVLTVAKVAPRKIASKSNLAIAMSLFRAHSQDPLWLLSGPELPTGLEIDSVVPVRPLSREEALAAHAACAACGWTLILSLTLAEAGTVREVAGYRDTLGDLPLAVVGWPGVVVGRSRSVAAPPGPVRASGPAIAGILVRPRAEAKLTRAIPADEATLSRSWAPEWPAGSALNRLEREQLRIAGISTWETVRSGAWSVSVVRGLGHDADRRYWILERAIAKWLADIRAGIAHVAFEPVSERLMASLRDVIERYLIEVWTAGELQGAKPEHAFFVRVGRSTTTPEDFELGRLTVLIGLAILRPSEFIVRRVTVQGLAE